jgi:hypothetical protein
MVRLISLCLTLAVGALCLASPSAANPQAEQSKPEIDLYALMSGSCERLKVAGHDFACKLVGYFHSEKGRASFTVVLDDPADNTHVISFSGEYGRRTQENRYVLAVDRMELKSKDRPKVDGLPVAAVELSDGVCQQLGNFATRQVSSVSCSAKDAGGRSYELQFASDGSPIILRRVRVSPPTIRADPYQ